MRDYLGAIFAKPGDKVDYGVKGMRWGVRRPRSVLRKEAAKRAAPAKKAESSGSSSSPASKAASGEETSAARYSRLAAQAKAGRGSEMSDTDLKFFNARTEALKKVNQMNETKPGWLAETSKTVLQQSARRQMQMVSDTLADKYIGKPIADALKTKPVKPEDDKSED